MPETIALILGFLPGWEVYAIHTIAGYKTSSELITRNNLLCQSQRIHNYDGDTHNLRAVI